MAIISVENMKVDVEGSTQEDVFKQLAETALQNGYIKSSEAIVNGFKKREAEGSTGMVDGFAIPHVQSDQVNEPAVMVFTLQEGVEWQSLDGGLVTIVVALLIPTGEEGTTHLQLLSKVARMLMKDDIKDQLKSSKTTGDIYDCLVQNLA